MGDRRPRIASCILKVPKSRPRKEDMSQQPQGTPPAFAQITSILVGWGAPVGIVIVFSAIFGAKVWPISGIPIFVAGFIGHRLTLSCLSRLFTGSWSKYPQQQLNVDMTD